jgi:hypothetical protein
MNLPLIKGVWMNMSACRCRIAGRIGAAALLLFLGCQLLAARENVIIVVIDGARHQETFGSGGKYIPRMWNLLSKEGTLFTNFRNDGITATCPGHASILTGSWIDIPNDGSRRAPLPTIFEYFRSETHAAESLCYVVSGKKKLAMLTFGADSAYGGRFGARFVAPDHQSDIDTWHELSQVLHQSHPQVVIVNFPDVDINGHAKAWDGYVGAIRRADSLINVLWGTLQADSVYAHHTTLLVTNDHGRHDDAHGGFQNHGDTCEGCRKIMLLALGPHFRQGAIVSDTARQTDIAPTVANILQLHNLHFSGIDLENLGR